MFTSTITLVCGSREHTNQWHKKNGKTVIATLKKQTAVTPDEELLFFWDSDEMVQVSLLPIEIDLGEGVSQLVKVPQIDTLQPQSQVPQDLTDYVAKLLARHRHYIPSTQGKHPVKKQLDFWQIETTVNPRKYSTLNKEAEKIQARLYDDDLDHATVTVTVPDLGEVEYSLDTVDNLWIKCKCGLKYSSFNLDKYRQYMTKNYGKYYEIEEDIVPF